MKKIIIAALALAALLLPAALAESCTALLNTGDHAWYQADVAMPTCESDGYYVLKCSSCGVTKKVITDYATGHHYVETGVWVDSTCLTQGWHTMRCTNCGNELTFTLPLRQHNWVDTGAGQKATCQAPGWRKEECSLCGSERTVPLAMTEHVFVSTGLGVPSTCLTQGYEQTECVNCGLARTTLLPLADHAYGAWVVSVPATDHSMGVRSRVCAVCGNAETANYYPDGALYRGCPSGGDVQGVQRMLADLNYLKGSADGVFGAMTETAVHGFQSASGLTADGVAWPQTISLLSDVWQQTMGIATEKQGGEMDYPDRCVPWAEDVQWEFVTVCGEHAPLVSREVELNAYGASLTQVDALAEDWERALNALYDQWAERCAGSAQVSAVCAAQTAFFAGLDAQDAAFGALTPDLRLRALRAECTRLCAMLDDDIL